MSTPPPASTRYQRMAWFFLAQALVWLGVAVVFSSGSFFLPMLGLGLVCLVNGAIFYWRYRRGEG